MQGHPSLLRRVCLGVANGNDKNRFPRTRQVKRAAQSPGIEAFHRHRPQARRLRRKHEIHRAKHDLFREPKAFVDGHHLRDRNEQPCERY